jgi:hypothetical protein
VPTPTIEELVPIKIETQFFNGNEPYNAYAQLKVKVVKGNGENHELYFWLHPSTTTINIPKNYDHVEFTLIKHEMMNTVVKSKNEIHQDMIIPLVGSHEKIKLIKTESIYSLEGVTGEFYESEKINYTYDEYKRLIKSESFEPIQGELTLNFHN